MDVIKLTNLSYRYEEGDENCLKDINLRIREGEFILLAGKSGCGKTTLTRCLNGLIPHFFKGELHGQVQVDGLDVQNTPSYEIAKRVGSVFQDPRSQFFTTNSTDEVAFGCENLSFPPAHIQQSVEDAFHQLHMEPLMDRDIFRLSSGERQKIAIASVCAMKPAVFVLDEPSANLDIRSTIMLADILKTLKAQGHTIIVSEHRLYYLMELADKVLYMRDGSIAEEWAPQEALSLAPDKLLEMGLRAFSLDALTSAGNRPRNGLLEEQPCLSAQNLSVDLARQQILQGVSFDAAHMPGGVIGITGENGVGKTTLVKTLCGLLKESTGTVCLNGRSIGRTQRCRASYFVMQDADYQLFTESVKDELRFGNRKTPDLDKRVHNTVEALELEAYMDVHPMALSGGQKQRVTIASSAISAARVLFFDEPTSGLDGGSMRNVSRMLIELSQSGKLVFVVSHDLEFLLHTCSRIIHIEKGRVGEDFSLENGTVSKLKRLLLEIGSDIILDTADRKAQAFF